MTNVNCLRDFKCPECGFEDEFDIEISEIATVQDWGVIDTTCNNEWTAGSWCRCGRCTHIGIVFDFTCYPGEKKPVVETDILNALEGLAIEALATLDDAIGARDKLKHRLAEAAALIKMLRPASAIAATIQQ